MIKLERTSVMNLENAMRGARNPMNSWGRMDSFYDEDGNYVLGPNDLGLAKRLRRAGSDDTQGVPAVDPVDPAGALCGDLRFFSAEVE